MKFDSALESNYKNLESNTRSIHQFKIGALNSSEEIDFKEFEGKKILMVNVASKCGFTNQYEDLEELSQAFNTQLIVIGLPCNQFLWQESGSEKSIAAFCALNYGVTFPMTTKVKVRGRHQHPIYKWLTHKSFNGKADYKVSWNFNKFLLDEQGQILEHFGSTVMPFDKAILKYLQ